MLVILRFYTLGLLVSALGIAVFGLPAWAKIGVPIVAGLGILIPVVDFCIYFWRHRKDD